MAYYVFKYCKKNGSETFHVRYDVWVDGKRKLKTLEPKDWQGRGFSLSATYAELNARAKQLSKEEHRQSWARKRDATKHRLEQENILEIEFLPKAYEDEFIREYVESSEDRARLQSAWRKARRIVAETKADWKKWSNPSEAEKVYRFFARHHLSPSWAKKITAVLNRWGEFCAAKQERHYVRLRSPYGRHLSRIADSFFDNRTSNKTSEPITLEDLKTLKDNLAPEQYRWVYLSVWFGLRPSEIDRLKDNHKVEDREDGIKELAVYQAKLVLLDRELRWKRIPILFPEQKVGLEYLDTELKRPLVKTLRRYLKKNVTCYGGRKGFEDLMSNEFKRDFFEVADWLGHATIERTWRSYRNRTKARLRKA